MNNSIELAKKYIEDVINDRIVVCNLTKLAIQRHLSDLKRKDLIFDEKKAQRAIKFFDFLIHTTGKFDGKPFILEPWQAFIIYSLFGWYLPSGKRRYNYAYIEVAKKNAKSTFAAAIGLYMMIADGETGAEIYSAATKYKQASIIFEMAKKMIKKSKYLKNYINIRTYNLHSEYNFSKFESLTSEANTQDGLNPYLAIIDEYHAHKDNNLINNLKSGMVSRKNPLLLMITTAGFNRESPCYHERKICVEILKGIKKQDNKFAIIYTLDDNDDFNNKKIWIKSNPNLGVSVDIDHIIQEYESAQNNQREIVNFKTKNLNIWTSASQVWIKDTDWMRCDFSKKINQKELIGKKCYGGLDLASHVDINALALFFPDEKNKLHNLLMFFWIPESKAESRTDVVDYKLWQKLGYINVTEGEVIDIDKISSDILDICMKYQVESIAIDPSKAYHGVVQNLQKNNITLTNFRQGFISMDAPTKELEKLILSRHINHFGNPVLRWMCGNAEISTDAAGNIKINKQKSIDKVDGMVAAVMAIGEWMTYRSGYNINEIYKSSGVKTL